MNVLCHRLPLCIYYKDTDAAGVVYYAKYAEFFEVGRSELLRECGFPVEDFLRVHGLVFPITELHIHYKKSISYAENVLLETTITECTRIRLRFDYQIVPKSAHAASHVIYCHGNTLNTAIHATTGAIKKFPADFYEYVKKHL